MNQSPEQPYTGPEFISPEPSRLQNLALRAGGILMGRGMNADPVGTLEIVAASIGGFEPVDTERGRVYKVPGFKPTTVMSAHDETAPSRPMQAYASHADFEAGTGTDDVARAIGLTVNGMVKEGPKASTIRGRAARGLVNYGTGRGHFISHILNKSGKKS